MSAISSCPHCAQSISIPSGAEPSEIVRCPLCQSEYPLHEALAKLPPMLVVVGHSGGLAVDAAGDSAFDPFDTTPEPTAVAIDPDTLTDEPMTFESASGDSAGLSFDEPMVALHAEPEQPLGEVDDFQTIAAFEQETSEADPLSLSTFNAMEMAAEHREAEERAAAAQADELSSDSTIAFTTEADDEISDLEPTELETPGMAASADDDVLAFGAGVPFESADEVDAFDVNAATRETVDASAFEANDGFNPDKPFAEDGADDAIGLAGEDSPDDDSAFKFPAAGAPVAAGKAPADGAPALKTSPRKERRKPSLVANLIGYVGGLLIAIPLAYLILMWGFHKDVLGVATKLPAWAVPAALAKPARPIAAGPGMPQGNPQNPPRVPGGSDDQPFATNVPALPPRDPGATPPALPAANPASNTPPTGAKPTPEDELPADEMGADNGEPADAADDPAAADNMAAAEPGDEMPADDAPADEAPADDATAAMPDDEKPADPDAMPDDEVAASETPDADPMDEQPADDVMAAEDEPPAVAAKPAVGPRDGVHYSQDDLSTAATEASDAREAMTGADKDAIKKLKSQFYRKLYHLAEVATFADGGDAGDSLRQMIAVAEGDQVRFAEIGKAAGKWMTLSKGKEHQGIVLAGTVQAVAKKGKVFETRVLLTDGTQEIAVLSPKAPTVAAQDQVVVAGSIVADPGKSVAGYAGDEPTAVWLGAIVPMQ